MFHSPFELETLANDRIATMDAKLDHADLLRQLPPTSSRNRSGKRLGRVRNGIGRGLIALGEHLTEQPVRPAPPAHQMAAIRPR